MAAWVGQQEAEGTVPYDLTGRLAASRFKDLFSEGMQLVEDVATYLDGPGRTEAKSLPRLLAAAYATESMRLTTRLMQLASWLLVQKAMNDGDLDRAKGLLEKNRVQVTSQGIATQAAVFAQLPDLLQEFTARSLRVQTRILQYDTGLAAQDALATEPGILAQFDLLRRAYGAFA